MPIHKDFFNDLVDQAEDPADFFSQRRRSPKGKRLVHAFNQGWVQTACEKYPYQHSLRYTPADTTVTCIPCLKTIARAAERRKEIKVHRLQIEHGTFADDYEDPNA